MNIVAKNYTLIQDVMENIFSSMWFRAFIGLIFLLLFLKIVNFFIAKLRDKIILRTQFNEAKKQITTTFELIKHIIDCVLILMFVLALLGKFGIDIKPLLATAGVAGLAIGFAAKSILEDLLQGIFLITSGQIRLGDYVEIAGKTGTVEKINIKLIALRDYTGVVHYIRNGQINTISNYTQTYSVAVISIGVSYDENPNKVTDVIKDIFYNELKTQPDFAKKILSDIEMHGLVGFGDSSINIRAIIKTLPREQWSVEREFNKLILERFKKEKIEIPYPYQNIVFKNNMKNLE